ncbi:hypothetical protein ACJX0J_014014, partial [Zea mays]
AFLSMNIIKIEIASHKATCFFTWGVIPRLFNIIVVWVEVHVIWIPNQNSTGVVVLILTLFSGNGIMEALHLFSDKIKCYPEFILVIAFLHKHFRHQEAHVFIKRPDQDLSLVANSEDEASHISERRLARNFFLTLK